jgi:tetratricopeptide (TPR) repeat protein
MTVLLFALALGVQGSGSGSGGTMNGDSAVALNNTAVALAEQGEVVRALPVLRRAFYLAPDSLEVAGNLASVQLRVGDVADAARLIAWIFTRLDERPGYRVWAYAVRAELCLTRKDTSGALADAGLAVELGRALDDFSLAAMWNLRGRAALAATRWEDAARDFQEAIALHSVGSARLAGYLENLAVALRRIKGKGREASKVKRRARAMYRRFVSS